MSAPHASPPLWAPRHRGWKLAHHLVPAFVLTAFLLGLAAYSLALGSLLFGIPLAALGAGTIVSIAREFRLDPAPVAPSTEPVATSGGAKAATRFAIRHSSPTFAALTVGLGVVTMVAALAMAAKFLLLHSGPERYWTFAAAAALAVVGFFILREGLRLMRIATSAQEPGVYLTRSRVVVFGPLGARELYWRDMASVSAENPPGRAPLGRRGPALIVMRAAGSPAESDAGSPAVANTGSPAGANGDGAGANANGVAAKNGTGAGDARAGNVPVGDVAAGDVAGADVVGRTMIVQVQFLLGDPNLLFGALRHYLAEAADRPELGTPAALERLERMDRS